MPQHHFNLRDYQKAAITILWESFKKQSRSLVVAPTAAGKTVIFGCLIKKIIEVKPDIRILVVTDQVKLVEQSKDKIEKIVGETVGIYCASLGSKNVKKRVTISTKQSILGKKAFFHLVIYDEAHKITQSFTQYFEQLQEINPKAKLAGFTATPYNYDGTIYGQEKTFPELTHKIPMEHMIKAGFICDYTLKSSFKKFDTKKLSKAGEDYTKKELSNLTKDEAKIAEQVQDMMGRVQGRKKIAVICINIKHAEQVQEEIFNYEMCCIQHSKLKEDQVETFEKSDVRFLVSVNQISEGYDFDQIDCIAIMRPTRSARLMVQIVGRGLRVFEGKKDCLILDYGDVFINCGTPKSPSIPRSKTRRNLLGEEKPIVKECPKCSNYVLRHIDKCDDCGYSFKRTTLDDVLKNLDTEANRSIDKVEVEFMFYNPRYKAKSGKIWPMVEFKTKVGSIKHFLFSAGAKRGFEKQSHGGKIIPKYIEIEPDGNYKRVKKIIW